MKKKVREPDWWCDCCKACFSVDSLGHLRKCGNVEDTPCNDMRPSYICPLHKWIKEAKAHLAALAAEEPAGEVAVQPQVDARLIQANTIMRFRKMLNRLGIHGYYNEMQKEFDDEVGAGEVATAQEPAQVNQSDLCPERWHGERKRLKFNRWRDGEPCDHSGCLSHVSHPCEGCGRIAGRRAAREGTIPSYPANTI